MKNSNVFNLQIRPQSLKRLSLTSLFTLAVLAFATSVFAQSGFSASELKTLKERKFTSDAARYHAPQDDSPLSTIKNQSRPSIADGNIDLTFNASVTEGFGYVNETVVQPDGKIIAVGLFQRANGARTSGIARFNADGTLDTSFNSGTGAVGIIRTVALQPDGKIIIAGTFGIFNDQIVRRIARLNSDGSLDSAFNAAVPNFNSTIEDVTLQPDGKILVGGSFNLSSARLARLNVSGTLDATFTPFNNTVRKIIYTADNKILVGGDFTGTYPRIARINPDGSPDASFTPGTGPNSPVFEIAVLPDGKIILGGVFISFNGTPTDAIAKLNANGSLDTAIQIPDAPDGTSLEIDALAVQPDGKFLASYYHEGFLVGWVSRVIRFNADGTEDATFTAGNSEEPVITDINRLSDGKFLIGGSFISYNSQPHLRLVKTNADGTLDNTFNPAPSTTGAVYAIKRQADGKIVIGGDFDYVNGVRRGGIARLNADGTLDNTFITGTGFSGNIFALAIQPDGKIIAGGDYFGYNNNGAFALSRLNSDGSFDMNLADVSGENAIFFVYSLALQPDGKILVGGQVVNIFNGFNMTLLRLNNNGTTDASFTSLRVSFGGTTRAILVQPDGKIVIGGTFNPSSPSEVPRTGLARLNANGTLDSGFTGNFALFYALAQQADSKVIAGGQILRRYAAADGAIDATFNAGTDVNNLIRAIEIQADGKILIGGLFTTYNGATANRVARVNIDGSLDTTFNVGAGASGSVLSLAVQPDGKILVGGQFLDFNNTEKLSLVRLQGTSSVPRSPFDFDGDGKTDIGIYRPSVGEWWINRSSNGLGYALQFGSSADKLTPVDFTGDGKTDVAFFRPVSGEWFVLRSEDNSFYSFPFGANGDIPAPADFDGDNKADAAVFRPSDSTWYIRRSSDGGTTIQQFGQTGDVPVVADYDGDNKADLAVYRVNSGEWWIQRSSAGLIAFQFGNSTDKPVQGDYTGDGKADVALFRQSTGEWFILRSENQSYYSFPFGTNGDTPAPGDYDGDGKFDATVFRQSNNTWYSMRTTNGTLIQSFGQNGDTPVPNAFVP
jgi:uncharacterized delta-60 repeat protein